MDNLTKGGVMTVLFKIAGFSFYTHGVFAVLGIILAAVAAYLLAKHKGLDTATLFDNIVYSVLAGIIGARISFFVIYNNQISDLKSFFYFWEGGLVSYGGFILGAVVFWFLIKKQNQKIMPWFDILGISFPIGLFMGRLGEYVSGENFGVPIPATTLEIAHQSVPINLYEAILSLSITLILSILFLKYYDKLKSGILFFASIILYTGGRFIIDFWRNENKILLNLSLGQIVSLLIFIVALVALIIKLKSIRKESYGTVI